MTLTNPYDKPPKKQTQEKKPPEKRDTHHASINQKKAFELCHYSTEAYKQKDAQEVGTVFIEHTVFLVNDIQVAIYTKDNKKIVAFRGTQGATDWLTDLNPSATMLSQVFPFIEDADDLTAHGGFLKSLAPIYEQIKKNIAGYSYDLTGHSLGAALASVFGYVYAIDPEGKTPDHFYTFGSPRVFLHSEKYPLTRYDDILEMVRIQNDNDVITYYPQKGGYQATAKHGIAGAVLGGVAGSVTGALPFGALLGAVSGAGMSAVSGGFGHVGTGLILFEDINSVVYTGQGKEKILKGRNYYLLPEGVDVMKDPLDIHSTLTQKIAQTATIESAFELVRRLYSSYSGFGDFFKEARRAGVISRMKTIFNVNVRGEIANKIVLGMTQQRHAGDVLSNSNLIYHANRAPSLKKRIWARPSEYLAGEYLKKFNIMADDMQRATASWLGRLSYTDAGFNAPITAEQLDVFSSVYHSEILKLMNDQLAGDSLVAKQFFHMLGLSMVAESSLVAYAGYDIYSKTVGHTLDNYKRRLLELPEDIYEGFTNADILQTEHGDFKKVAENVYFQNGHYYNLTHTGNKTTLRPVVREILGYVLYSPEQEHEHVNNVILF